MIKLHKSNIRLSVVGDLSAFDPHLVELIHEAEALTCNNTALTLSIAANYGGRWDILQAIQQLAKARPQAWSSAEQIQESDLTPYLSMAWAPEPDLFIRTGGESRISNFLIWQLAYTELYFTDKYWPDFSNADMDQAIAWYAQRERRFGRTSAQVHASSS